MLKVFKLMKVRAADWKSQVRIGSGGWLIREKFSTEKDHPMFGTRRANGLADLRNAWLGVIFVY